VAAKWVQQMPAGITRDNALGPLVFKLAQYDPETASKWIGLFSDSKQQRINVENVFRYWRTRDPAAAREWVKSQPGIDKQWKTKFLRQNE
jgi:hypothetical protein